MSSRSGSMQRLAPRRGFTLVELLMVVVIIGLLMALLLPAIGRARLTAQRAAVTAEISQLNAAMAQYASNHGEYPPNLLQKTYGGDNTYGDKIVARHFRNAFPRRTFADWEAVRMQIQNKWNKDINMMTPAEALVFWLGGIHNSSNEMQGFSKNPLDPFDGGNQRTTPLFDFPAERLADTNENGWLEFYPAGTGFRAPYVYFGSLPSGQYVGEFQQIVSGSYANTAAAAGVARPYRTASGGYVNPRTCQIIWSGFDFDYGADNTNKQYPTGNNYGPGDYDNQTNFVTGILEDSLP